MSNNEFEKEYNTTVQAKATAWYIQEALSIQMPDIDMKEVEDRIVEIIREYTAESDIKLEAILRHISAIYSMKLARKQLMICTNPQKLV